MSIDIEQFHAVFFDESLEHLDAMEHGLLTLDVENPDLEAVNSIFRAAHSIKGGSGIFGFDALTRLTHIMENLLDKARKGTHQLDVPTVTLFLETVDLLRVILDAYRENSDLPADDIEQGEKALEDALNDSKSTVSSSQPHDEKAQESDISEKPASRNNQSGDADQDIEGFGFFDIPEYEELSTTPDALADTQDITEGNEVAGYSPTHEANTGLSQKTDDNIEGFGFFDIPEYGELATRNPEARADTPNIPEGEEVTDYSPPPDDSNGLTQKTNDDIEGFGFFDHPEPDLVATQPKASAQVKSHSPNEDTNATSDTDNAYGFFCSTLPVSPPSEGEGVDYGFYENQKSTLTDRHRAHSKTLPRRPTPHMSTESVSIRVDTQKIDAMVNLVGELVITQSMLSLISEEIGGPVGEKLQNAIGELQRNTREIQESAMSMRMLPLNMTFNRFPRVVRDLSSKLGKKVDLQLEGGNTEIDKSMIEKLVDPLTHLVRNSIDHGIETTEKRRAAGKNEMGTVTLRAMQKGSSIQLSITDDGAGLNRERIINKAMENGLSVDPDMTDDEVWQLIFQPGFSTAAEVTDVSGRGVGMDVVKRNIESIGGRIDIESATGRGSSFTISLPLTLAIVDGISVAVGEQTFVVPLVNIIESIQPFSTQLKYIGNERLLWIREQYWPLVALHEVMDVENAQRDPTQGIVVLLESGKRRFGVLVDALLGQQQVVIKSLERHYRKVAGVSGATIMGDGRVAMIIDVEGIAELCQTPDVESLSA